MAEKTNVPLWTFYYHQGPAPKYGTVEASNESNALKVATRWCKKMGFRPPASVQPMILATEAILKEREPGPEEESGLADEVAATTGTAKG